jgi:hypothetical protein
MSGRTTNSTSRSPVWDYAEPPTYATRHSKRKGTTGSNEGSKTTNTNHTPMPPLWAGQEQATNTMTPEQESLGTNIHAMMHPTEVTPTHELAIAEINQQMTEGQKTYDSVDMKSKIVTRVHKVIWPRAKYPDYRGISGQFVYGYLRSQTLGRPQQEFKNRWMTMRRHVTDCLRTRRSYVVQLMKATYLPE